MKRTLLLDFFSVILGLAFLAGSIYIHSSVKFDIEALLKLTH